MNFPKIIGVLDATENFHFCAIFEILKNHQVQQN